MDRNYLKSVAASGLFKYLKPAEYEGACSELNMAPRKYVDQQIIYGQDSKVTRAAIVHEGFVKGERLHVEGTSNLAYLYGYGEVFAFEGALSGKKTSPLQLTAEGDATVIFFDVQKIFLCSFERELTLGLMELLANDNIKKLYRVEILSCRGLRDRILAYFKIMASQSGDSSFTLNMSREQLARYLCVNRSALSYELNQMKREGIIAFDRKRVTLLQG